MSLGSLARKKLIVVLGQTASGKTELSLKLALWLKKKSSMREFGINGAEIVSADSRQVYRGMDIGTDKITGKEMIGVAHHLLDVASPKRKFTVGQYQKLALKKIGQIHQENKIPILVGGSGFYIQSVVKGIVFPQVKPDRKLRARLEKETAEELLSRLKKFDPKRAGTIEKKNKRRIIRALEIIIKTKKPVPPLTKNLINFDILIVGIKKNPNEIKKLVKSRFEKRLKSGMVAEARRLKNSGLSWKRLEEFGLDYRYAFLFLQKKISKEEMKEKIEREVEDFARRQMTWFKRDKKIIWIKNYGEAKLLARKFLC